ncbi:slipin family protein [Kitasatospora purpeofusca]|uniref:slipin family protein n=1 Tax=Kitasatospora purpeofusca TaxID=67352 RepID=UPI002250E85E|nr:slipin family protein [Kitasatospora purpeofusca]MCX4758570.1 slipin family protein [Kitasatospora purpeofusca]WSR30988.1 slipin family protein [Kitasatospora purpeofusca]WSR39021.1 slipin family protein [Kitasatospora purpeofusca]
MVVDVVIAVVVVVLLLTAVVAGLSLRVVQQFQQGVVFRFGRVRDEVRGPGLVALMPVADKLRRVNVQIVTLPIPAQEGITRDNVTVRVDAVVYFRVEDPVKAIINVQDYNFAISQVAQTSLRSIIGKSELDDLLANREPINQGLELMIDSPALGWGIEIDRVEIKDVALPESMKRSMSRQAEAERERRARIITADGEFQASARLSEAAAVMSATPAALQLRLLQTVVEVAAEKNSTLVLPFPVELLRFLDSAAETHRRAAGEADSRAAAEAAAPTPGEPAEVPGTERGTPSVRAAEVHELPPLEELLGSPPLDVPPVPPLDPPADVPDDGPADSSEGPEGGRGAAA